MTSPWIASLLAIFVWWFSTGAILLAVRRADRSGKHLQTVITALPLLVFGGWAVWMSLADTSVIGIYLGFLGALAIWGWIELAFLAGVVTGPMRDVCPPGLQGKDRFFRAFGTVAYHELLLTVGLLALVTFSGGSPNQMGMAAYLVLFLARILAKLNLFYGVPRINTEFVPARLAHLKSYFHRGPVTYAFPIAITILTALLVVCAERLWTASSDTTVMGYALLTALAALALLEHWLMVVPLPDAKLWRWMLPDTDPAPNTTLPNED
ncbi:putative photosynthetic complex assembly protein PuhE [Yoonia sediminilitoris]|uniref:Putative photosynthetic complex assembly protein 2 n=1 Tax=Yoonia sediminilitoris TaxID=1286148 RepID=A0A2T6KMH3_9RHOB|nr:putative photosynthetic complex assembly protein PuhE [Yoonia sediminilitoris]PUB17419.1 putative photosynthetic complex assembly protein 2 [Yoonia sediminilitoris]RCW97714.1 putative photosynthetic complex assembly protein 2 [Yoonia sediminilitoris]